MKVQRSLVFSLGIIFAFQVSAESADPSCDGASKVGMPVWVSQPDYSLVDAHIGVGSADRNTSKNKVEQAMAAQSNAKFNLLQSIEVSIRAENGQSTHVNNQGVQQDSFINMTEISDEVLRGLKIKAQWIDPQTCTYHILMVISKASVELSKREKVMRNHLIKFKLLLAEGIDRDKNRDIKLRRKYLEDAQVLLSETEFDLLPDELKKDSYIKKLNNAFSVLHKEASKSRGRIALFAIYQEGKLNTSVVSQILDQLKAGNTQTDRIAGECNTADSCINLASEQGFSKLALLNASSRVETSPMGSIKGTLTISRTVYDIESRKAIKSADTVSAQVIAWSHDELDWTAATEKAMLGLK